VKQYEGEGTVPSKIKMCEIILQELTMINNGEANMEMSEKTLKYPTKICLS
jgi:hypothetical protein